MNTHRVLLKTVCGCERTLEFEWPDYPPEFLTVVLDGQKPPSVLASTEVLGSFPCAERREFKGQGVRFSSSGPLTSFPAGEPLTVYEEAR